MSVFRSEDDLVHYASWLTCRKDVVLACQVDWASHTHVVHLDGHGVSLTEGPVTCMACLAAGDS